MQIFNSIQDEHLEQLISLAFEEDLFSGDIATEAIMAQEEYKVATLTAKADGIISGLKIAERIIAYLGEAEFTPLVEDGDEVKKGEDILKIRARYDHLLKSERIMLNFLQRMSGIATATNRLVKLIGHTNAKLLDTRKTVPGHRLTDKMAVRHGGGTNHRMGLYDMAMLKDNHIKAAGGITPAVQQVRKVTPISIRIEVETSTLEQVLEAVEAGADVIMLDNMDTASMKEAVAIINGRAKTEASGNINEGTIAAVAETGVDYISVGSLTHSVRALDISMNF
ncbi:MULTISPECIES: carboxylating nicotinate-nucleotide diphosphorylase [unclassified Porphyromonas]|uniref:carboxylating nicotinate-nucleotide diphosphorylase n=1 Tax=unclassified Porphyromonas TaxID=2645799 RepID=UPI00052C6D6C|nr:MULTISPECIES: carboxylating nicotinate-nucleotide diphosphorylase [unclassified Porphyromonas]KGN71920.1 nicotinate-nucleotide pyrophosphorylase [Porphyromonas sp. COT-108 OH1349]KGN94685.1 nicotinate-nucleotide pyrophosphorylase [Porphyromonas sp. COT-108 OH2963]